VVALAEVCIQQNVSWRKSVLWTLVALFLLGAVLLVNAYVNHQAQALARDMLAEHFHSEVELGSIHVRLLPTVQVTGTGLTVVQSAGGAKLPFIHAEKFSASTSLWNMLTRTRHLHRVRASGLVITVARHAGAANQPAVKRKVPEFDIDELEANQATLVILASDPAKRSLVYHMHRLVLKSAGASGAMHYRALLENALPPGEIEAEGNFGPWNYQDSGATHVDGKYEFKKADLSVFHEISGTLSSQGTFTGELGRIDVQGTTDTPDFKVKAGNHATDLKTTFSATVDGTNGDTQLHNVEAHFENSTVAVKGSVVDVPGPLGHIIDLDVRSSDAHVEDMLKMAVKPPPAMHGGLQFAAKLKIIPGDGPVRSRITAEGQAEIANGTFRKASISEKIAELSHKAEGELKADNDEQVPAKFKTTFRLAKGTLNVPSLEFDVPGAEAKLHGSYNVNDKTLDFSGTAMLHAELSQMTTGFKSFLLKAVDPFFKSKSAGTVLPITITGTRADPKFKVELKRLKEAKKTADAD